MSNLILLTDIKNKPEFINDEFISSLKKNLGNEKGVIATHLNDIEFIELYFEDNELYAYCIVNYFECDDISKEKLKKPYLYN